MRLRRLTDSDSASPKHRSSRHLVRPLAFLTAVALIPMGLLVLEHASAAAPAPAVRLVKATHTLGVAVNTQVATLTRSAGSLETVSQMLTASRTDVDAATARATLSVASEANAAAAASRNLATIVRTAKASDPAQVSAAVNAANTLKSTLAQTSQGANALATPAVTKIKFCTIRIVVFPGFTLRIPGIITIVIPPIVIKIRVPCFISGDF